MADSGITLIRSALKTVMATAFPDVDLILDDHLHESLGHDGQTRIGISPLSEGEFPGQANLQQYRVKIQLYRAYDKKVDPQQSVDPTAIETDAATLKAALKDQLGINDPTAWFFRLIQIDYPKDPTGNKTRLEAEVLGYGDNQTQV